MKAVVLKNTLIALAISLLMVSCGNEPQNIESSGETMLEEIDNVEHDIISENTVSQNITEMYPCLGRSLNFTPQGEKDWQTCEKLMSSVDYDYDKLTKEQQAFIDKVDYQESMTYWGAVVDGCSWYCAGGPDSVSASSYLKSNSAKINYLPENAHDLSFETAWVPAGNGIGEYLVYHFLPTAPRITKIIIANGYVKSEKAYRENSRVKKLKMYIDNKPFAILNLEDVRQEQVFVFEPIGKRTDNEKLPKWTIKFEILEVYKGDKYEDVAISEIYFDGIDVHCFAAGTKILMSDNSLKNIELIQEGDMVKSYDFENKKLINSKVTKLISATHSNLLKLKFADNEIITTTDHPFWIERNVWAAVNAEKANKDYFQKTKVENLKVGDKIFIPEKNSFSEILAIENTNKQQITYTIELAENDNFIANGMLVKTEIAK